MKSFYIETLGCPKNRVDSEIMLARLLGQDYTYEGEPAKAAIIIVNTCGFLASAVSESIERILDLSEFKKSGNCELLIAAGCMVERYKSNLLKEIPEIDGVIGTSDYAAISDCIRTSMKPEMDQDKSWSRPYYSPGNFELSRQISTRAYAYLKIGEGCSNGCSFCNIPKLRGKQVSRESDSIKREFSELLERGVKEINLISQDSSSYGRDLENNGQLADLVQEILKENRQDFWLRILYTYPNRYPVELFQLMEEDSRLVPYADIPFQHISDKVLKDMNRKIQRVQLEELLDNARNTCRETALRTTFIVGFPTETENDFAELLAFIEKGHFDHIGVFTYSHEDNIRSYQLGDRISEEEKNERRNILMKAQQAVSLEKNRARIGQIQKVLIEGEYEETALLLKGRTRFQGAEIDGNVLINDGIGEIGQFCNVKITEAHPYDLVGGIV